MQLYWLIKSYLSLYVEVEALPVDYYYSYTKVEFCKKKKNKTFGGNTYLPTLTDENNINKLK